MSGHKPVEDRPSRLIHDWFGLSYGSYLTIPRSVLQSMPDEWQAKFVVLLDELDSEIEWRPDEGCYWVALRDEKGRFIDDPAEDYERGRRRFSLRSQLPEFPRYEG